MMRHAEEIQNQADSNTENDMQDTDIVNRLEILDTLLEDGLSLLDNLDINDTGKSNRVTLLKMHLKDKLSRCRQAIDHTIKEEFHTKIWFCERHPDIQIQGISVPNRPCPKCKQYYWKYKPFPSVL